MIPSTRDDVSEIQQRTGIFYDQVPAYMDLTLYDGSTIVDSLRAEEGHLLLAHDMLAYAHLDTINTLRQDSVWEVVDNMKQTGVVAIGQMVYRYDRFKEDVIEDSLVYYDGSKFRGNASNRETKSKQGWENNKERVSDQINKILELCEQIDEEESGSLVQLKKELKSKENRLRKIDKILQSFDGQKSINGTDKACKIMRGRQGSHAGFNGQLTVDEQHGLIVSFDAVQDIADYHQLTSQIMNAEEVTGKPCDTVCADSGYASIDSMKPLFDNGKEVIVPTTAQAEDKVDDDHFSKSHFKYNIEKDEYTCPVGKEMYRSYQAKGSNKVTYRMKDPKACLQCINYGICTKAKRGRTINRLVNEELLEHQRRNYEKKDNQEIYAKRKMLVEHPFGHIKRNLGAGAFLMRGIKGVNAELSILGTCFNVARLITILGGVQNLIYKFR